MERVIVKGIGIIPFKNSNQLLEYIESKAGILIAVNAEKILKADDQLRSLTLNHIGYCDGVGAVLILKKYGVAGIQRIPGVELWLNIVERYYRQKTFYLIGSKESTINEVVEKLKVNFAGIQILGYRDGYFKSEEERSAVIEDVMTKKPDFVFVAMGSPKQEELMTEMYAKHKVVYQGLGGSFDVYSGHIKRAPKLFRTLGLEWAYRLIKEPSRFRRYLPLFKFVFLIFRSKRN